MKGLPLLEAGRAPHAASSATIEVRMFNLNERKGKKVTTVGIDLAKKVFSVHAIDVRRKVLRRQTVRCDHLGAVVAKRRRA